VCPNENTNRASIGWCKKKIDIQFRIWFRSAVFPFLKNVSLDLMRVCEKEEENGGFHNIAGGVNRVFSFEDRGAGERKRVILQ
jgi:hypothetical protein